MIVRTTVALLTGAMVTSVPTLAQQPGQTARVERVPVTVVFRETPAEAAASYTVLRRAAQTPRDVIVLVGPATGRTLSDAVRTLLYARMAEGDTAVRDAAVRTRQSHSANHHANPYPWAERVVYDVKTAPQRDVSGVGRVRAVEIWLPPQRGRRRRGT
jgi:hypothetical protein